MARNNCIWVTHTHTVETGDQLPERTRSPPEKRTTRAEILYPDKQRETERIDGSRFWHTQYNGLTLQIALVRSGEGRISVDSLRLFSGAFKGKQ